jgi:uncharacterized GH25 family protein
MTLSRTQKTAAFLSIAFMGAAAAQAHMPYVLPTIFDVGKGDHITVESSFGEDAFVPEVSMRDAPFHLVGPDGKPIPAGSVVYLRDLSVFEADTKVDGTYRVTTGQRFGRIGTMFQKNGAWVMRGEQGEPEAGTKEVQVQSATIAEAYVTKGAPSQTALKPTGKALEIQAVTHPNSITAGTDAEFVLLFEGKPLAGVELTLFRSAGFYDGRKVAAQVKSDAAGRFKLKPDDAGTYLILVRHRGTAPAGAETPFRSYTYTLAFDAA